MWVYLLRRLLAIIPTLIGITLISFVVINLAIDAVYGLLDPRIRVR